MVRRGSSSENYRPVQVLGGAEWLEEMAVEEPRKRWELVAAPVLVIALVLIGFGGIFSTMDGDRAPVIPDFSRDLTLVGDALTAAHNSGDLDRFLSLFAADAQLEFSGAPGFFFEGTVSLTRYREFLESWSRVMNEQWEWLDCQLTGNTGAALCQVRITNDWLELLFEEPDRARVTVQMVDGRVTQWDFRGLRSPNDLTVARFEDWTHQLHPILAATMWQSDGSIFPIFTEESARLHLQLGQEYMKQIAS